MQQRQLSYHHAGVPSWYPFDELLRTLNLLKPTGGPVIARQFYHWLEPVPKPDRHIDRVIYSEPLWDYDDPEKTDDIHPLLLGYSLGPSDKEPFSKLRKQLTQCFAQDAKLDNTHLRTAIHWFENADRRIVPSPLSGSFDAIDPLMSYEAALEALFIGEKERQVENKLSKRVVALLKMANTCKTEINQNDIENFVRRVFWLRSKVAHGVRPFEEIEGLIINKPDEEIVRKHHPIPKADYQKLLIDGLPFPGFLVNLRELTRRCIRYFCDALS